MLINEAVLHILDKNSGNLLLSQAPLQLGDPFLIEYITKLVDKIKKGDPHIGQLAADEPLLGYLADEGISFLEKTQQLSDKLFALIAPAEEIGPADYLFFTGTSDTGGTLFGMIRLDYSSKVTHFVDYEGEAVSNTILQNHAILPNATQKPSEAFIVDLSNGNYHLIEKKVVIEGQQTAYFSEKFLEITVPVTTKEQIKEIKKTVTHIAKKHDEEPYKALATTQQAIFHQLRTRRNRCRSDTWCQYGLNVLQISIKYIAYTTHDRNPEDTQDNDYHSSNLSDTDQFLFRSLRSETFVEVDSKQHR